MTSKQETIKAELTKLAEKYTLYDIMDAMVLLVKRKLELEDELKRLGFRLETDPKNREAVIGSRVNGEPTFHVTPIQKIARQYKGRPSRRLFSDDQVRIIRQTYASGVVGLTKLSKRMNCTPTTIVCIVKNKTYRDVK